MWYVLILFGSYHKEMDCDSLIDFNSPLNKGSNMLDPLVPLPQSQTNNVHENIAAASVGDNPFDNAILQMCKLDDPFEMTEKQALDRSKDNNHLLQKQTEQKQPIGKSSILKKEANDIQMTTNVNKCNSPQGKSGLDISHTMPSITLDNGQSTSLNEKSLSETYLSPTIGTIESKFSKLYLSAQLDKQLLDESSKCINSGDQDMSFLNVSKTDAFDRSLRSPSPMKIPKGTQEVKAFVANRIEKCIEKALNESRKSFNCSFRHRRSLSATSLCTSTLPPSDNPYNYSSLQPQCELSSIASKYRNRSFSKPDLHSSLSTNMWGSQHSVLDLYTGETLSNATSRFNTAFRKSTASSSMYSSYGVCNTGFRRSTPSLSSFRRSNSFANISSSEVNGDDSVFWKDDTIIMGGRSSSCVFMEAKNLSCILQRRATAGDDEPIDADVNFLTDGNFQVELVDSDSSCSENDVEKGSPEEKIFSGNKAEVKNQEGKSSHAEEAHLPLSRDKIARMGLRSNGLQPKTSRSPLLVPLPPVPLSSNNVNLVLKPKSQSDGGVGKRGPMKAMIPVGNMMRPEVKKANGVPSKQAVGHHQRGETKSLSSVSVRRSVLTGDKSQKNRVSPATSQMCSPAVPQCGRPIACSTPDGVLPLVSPSATLQVSHIAKETPVVSGHRRSKSAGITASGGPEGDSQLPSTPVRKPMRHARSTSGLTKISPTKSKQRSPDPVSPNQTPVYTSTPLKSITKNSPTLNRVRKPSPVNRKLLQRENSQLGKENFQPRVQQKQRPQWRASTRRMEVQ